MSIRLSFLLTLLLISLTNFAQQYTVNGSATQTNCHCYVITRDVGTTSGSVWNNNKINLNQSFDFVFTVNLGCKDATGADGIAFVLQPISTSVGTTGNGLGFGGVSPSIGVTLDTWQNGGAPDNDPAYDHIAIQRNGDLNHLSANNLAGPVTIANGNDNVEDCLDHSLRVKWNATTKTLETFFDGVLRTSTVSDIVANTFNGDPMVFWGFTGSTGGSSNLQSFCTALSPNFKFSPAQKRCIGEAITFYDSTVSFTTIAKFYWDFGDGSNIDSVNLNPTHTYTIAKDYTVTQKVRGADGCEETNTQTVRVGSKPVAGFKILDSCVANSIQFNDTSKTAVGTVNNWYWNLGNGITSTLQNPSTLYSGYGVKNIKLAVKSLEGCLSDTLYKTITIRAQPIVDFNFTDSVCLGSTTSFTANINYPDGFPITAQDWKFDGTAGASTLANPQYTFTTPGVHTALLTSGFGTTNCISTKQKNVFVIDKPHAAIKFITSCEAQQVQLFDSSYSTDGVAITGSWWDLGNGQTSTQLHPLVTYTTTGLKTIRHVVYNAKGCFSDTISLSINVYSKPIAKFGIGNILCNNSSIQFFDSSATADGIINKWTWINADTVFSTQQNANAFFLPGLNRVGLISSNNFGCVSDTVYNTFSIKTSPTITMNFKDACKFAPVTFTAAEITSIGITSWNWIFGDGSTATGSSVTHTYNTNNNYNVKLYAMSSEGCTTDTLQRKINIYGTNAFAGNDTIAAAGQRVPLHASGGLSYLWTTGAQYLSNPNIANPFALLDRTQTFTLKAFTPEGCESFDEVTVKIYDGPEIYLPTAFTPNNDGLNDLYRGIFVGISKFNYMRIFNRWGQMIFSANSLTDGWNGKYKGVDQQPGSYIVIVSGVDFKGKVIEKKISFQLLR